VSGRCTNFDVGSSEELYATGAITIGYGTSSQARSAMVTGVTC
jgi:hypothetical protein